MNQKNYLLNNNYHTSNCNIMNVNGLLPINRLYLILKIKLFGQTRAEKTWQRKCLSTPHTRKRRAWSLSVGAPPPPVGCMRKTVRVPPPAPTKSTHTNVNDRLVAGRRGAEAPPPRPTAGIEPTPELEPEPDRVVLSFALNPPLTPEPEPKAKP